MTHQVANIVRVAIGIAVLTAAGCITPPPPPPPQPVRDDVRFDDEDAPAYTGSIIFRPEDMRFGSSGLAGRGGVEFTYERYRGESEQTLEFFHYVQLDSTSLDGPQTITNTVDVEHGHIGYNHLFNFGSHFEVEPMLGVGYDKMIATARGQVPNSPIAKDDQHSWGVVLRVTPRFMINSIVGLETRLGTAVDFDGEGTGMIAGAVVLRPIRNIELKAGYYAHEQSFDLRDGTSDVEAEFSGFLANLTLIF